MSQGRDFLLEDNSNQTMNSASGRDFLLEDQPQKESFGKSAAYALPRAGEDLVKGAYRALKSIPDYYESAKTEVPGSANMIMHHPVDALKQLGAGVTELGHNVLNMRPNFYKYMEDRLNLLPKGTSNIVAPAQPEIEPQINALFGEAKQPGEKLIRGAGRNAANILGGVEGIGALKFPLNTEKAVKNSLLNTHDVLENKASEGFKHVSNEVNNKGINKLDLSHEPIDFQELKGYFPNTKQYNALLQKSQTGDYNALRKLQSDLYTRAKQNLGSSLEADRMRGSEMLERREHINNAISNHLEKTGNHDLNNVLNAARDDYRTLQKIYYNENMNPAIVNMVNKDYRKIPKNLLDVLQEESNPMKQLKDFHPGLESNIKKYNFRKNALSNIKKYAIPVGLGAVGGYGATHYSPRQ